MNGHVHGRTWEALHAFAIMYEIPSKYLRRITNSKIDPIFFDKKKRKTGDRTYARTYEERNVFRNCLLRAQFKKKNIPIYVNVLHNLSFS